MENRNALKVKALSEFLAQNGRTREHIGNAFELCIDDILEQKQEKYKTWKQTKENVDFINKEIMELLKKQIEQCLEGGFLDPQQKLDDLFSGTSRHYKEEKESKTMERERVIDLEF